MSAPAPPVSAGTPTPGSDAPTSYTDAFRGRAAPTKFADPCDQARQESMKCLDVNSYNKAKCNDFFQAYRDCKANWLKQRRDDRRAGKDVA